MTIMNLKDRVKQIVAEKAYCKDLGVTDEKHLVNDLLLDSLDKVELVMALEDEFNIEIADEEGEACDTVKEVVTLVETKVAKLHS